ncbi:acetylornithine deacetylase [Gammaproteobacteria bacterium]|nr:acetylornithine deacetylase [Gammaproteobacteria bacterium]
MNTDLELTLQHLKALVACDTSNPPRKINQSGLIEYLNSLDFIDPEISDLGEGSINIMLTKGSPRYLINVHLDTVPAGDGWQSNPHDLTIKDGRAIGLGACDIKGAAACLLTLVEKGLENYAILFSTDEEAGQSTCIKDYIKTQHTFEGVIVAEPTQNKAVTCHRGILTGTQEFFGLAGHSSEQRALTDNAIHKLTRWSDAALKVAESYNTKSFKDLHGIAFNLGLVEGGIKPNIIADHAQVKFGMRPLPGQSFDELLSELNTQTAQSDAKFTAGFVAPALPASGDIAEAESFADELGLTLSPPVNFWTEASLFSEAGYRALVYGPGNIANAHQPDEFVDLDDLNQALIDFKKIIQ